MEIKLSDVEVGTPLKTRYNYKRKEDEPFDIYEAFLDRLHDKKKNYQTKKTSQSLFLRRSVMAEDADMYHRNYLEYLETCWANHLGITITPDIIWYTLTCELASLVKAEPDEHRHIFTDSDEKKEIVVLTGDPIEMPLGRLTAEVRDHIPTDTMAFFPEFSTTSQRSRHAMQAAFCDMCSPYYNYSMMMCAFPSILIQGTKEDYQQLAGKWGNLWSLDDSHFKRHPEWFQKVQMILDNCIHYLEDQDWWQNMFKLDPCGSGHQVQVSGWFSQLFREKPSIAYVNNFSTSVSEVSYKYLGTGKNYVMQDGLFYSHKEGNIMMPDFGYSIHEKTEPEEESFESGYSSIPVRTTKIKTELYGKVDVSSSPMPIPVQRKEEKE
jgi:hypothetical protein